MTLERRGKDQVFSTRDAPYQERVEVGSGGGIPAPVLSALWMFTAYVAIVLGIIVGILGLLSLVSGSLTIAAFELGGSVLLFLYWLAMSRSFASAARERAEKREINRQATEYPWTPSALEARAAFEFREAQIAIMVEREKVHLDALRRLSQVFRQGDRIEVTPFVLKELAAALGLPEPYIPEQYKPYAPLTELKGGAGRASESRQSPPQTTIVDSHSKDQNKSGQKSEEDQEQGREGVEEVEPAARSRLASEMSPYKEEDEEKERRARARKELLARAQRSLEQRKAEVALPVNPVRFQQFLDLLCEEGKAWAGKPHTPDRYKLSYRRFYGFGFSQQEYAKCLTILYSDDARIVTKKGEQANASFVLEDAWKDYGKLCGHFVQFLPHGAANPLSPFREEKEGR